MLRGSTTKSNLEKMVFAKEKTLEKKVFPSKLFSLPVLYN